MTTAIGIERLNVARGGSPVVNALTLDISARTWFGLIGANGSGKTSLLRAIAGRLPIDRGRCLIDGADLTDDRGARASEIGFAPMPDMLPGALTGGEVLAMIAGSVNAALDATGPLGAALGLDRLVDRAIGACSAGMRQRISVACAFAEGKRIVILDEPFNWLDPVAAYDTRRALRAMVDDGLTLVTALHDLSVLVSSCDGGALLSAGALALSIDRAAITAAASNPVAFERHTIELLRSDRG